jgi:hypothetical protein
MLFSRIAFLINNKEHQTKEGLYKILSIRASMNKGLSSKLKKLFPNLEKVERPIIKNKIIKSPF